MWLSVVSDCMQLESCPMEENKCGLRKEFKKGIIGQIKKELLERIISKFKSIIYSSVVINNCNRTYI